MSVFTFDPDPPRVSSPWLRPEDSEKQPASPRPPTPAEPAHSLLSEYGLTKLPPEPQEGPIEYKLHLLLRPRRAYDFTSTTSAITGSHHSKQTAESAKVARPRAVLAPSSGQGRQERCQQLTTQLLWRLRQSSPFHASTSYQDIDVPVLPDDSAILSLPVRMAKLAPGLEESRGALYEIGVADDGTLVGIAKDELDQSIATLRWIAANLGCNTEVLRMVVVGDCEWVDDTALVRADSKTVNPDQAAHREKLWVAEVLVKPELNSKDASHSPNFKSPLGNDARADSLPRVSRSAANQLRVTLAGPTTSGKSSLLGTLCTGTLDDGHGKSRQNSLKHLHELASGLTSTVTQELIGYKDNTIVNYANPNIESWIGIHDYAGDGRLVLISDSAGHPRYRRTTLRGIVGWAPHWTLLCMAADNVEDHAAGLAPTTPSHDGSFNATELARAHLDLCLKLELPLVVVLTKSDLLNRESLKRTLVPVWTAVKNAGRVPILLQSKPDHAEHLREISASDNARVQDLLGGIEQSGNFLTSVPVVLTSAVRGDGISLVHALLKNLPRPAPPTAQDYIGRALNPEQPRTLFHIEDKFSLPASYASVSTEHQPDQGTVVAGYLRFGSLTVGDRVVVGPFPSEEDDHRGATATPEDRPSPGSNFGLFASHSSSSELNRIALRNAVAASAIKGEWHGAHVVSIRNLRLPVQTLESGQVATIGIIFDGPKDEGGDDLFERMTPAAPKLRRGMVLAIPSKHMLDTGLQLQAASGLTAFFKDPAISSLAIGTGVMFYVASVRARARVVSISPRKSHHDPVESAAEDHADVFGPADDLDGHDGQVDEPPPLGFDVTLELLYGREWIELGSRIVILEGASKEGSLLDGFVGKVDEIVD